MSDTYIGKCKVCKEETDLIWGICGNCVEKKSEVVLNEQTIRGDIAVADDKYDLELTIDQVNKLAHVIAQAGKEIVK